MHRSRTFQREMCSKLGQWCFTLKRLEELKWEPCPWEWPMPVGEVGRVNSRLWSVMFTHMAAQCAHTLRPVLLQTPSPPPPRFIQLHDHNVAWLCTCPCISSFLFLPCLFFPFTFPYLSFLETHFSAKLTNHTCALSSLFRHLLYSCFQSFS